jgi:phosphatase NudJ
MRFILLAHPVSSLPPKSLADQESLQARWVTPEQLPEYPLRNPEVE